jgi:ATP-binding cassette subfamily C (CFTR/MRP) protein 1
VAIQSRSPGTRFRCNDYSRAGKSRLWATVDERGGLAADLDPETLFHGEQQLLAFGGAILRKQLALGRCIMVLDEVTSNLDPATEARVHELIRNEFAGITVIMIAHWMQTLKDVNCTI